ncbi:hypothetical protein BGZ49_005946 [Haplosporangium sp. Z 27]|nr:hypothetical protein BGZ49_005946 [Haplosporangium sp. Z 27]
MADSAATFAVRRDTKPWQVDLSAQRDITFWAKCHKELVEIDLRQLLKQQSTIRRHQAFTTQRRVKRALPDMSDIEWRSTLSIVHDKRAVHTFYSNAKDTRQRTHHLKKLLGMLPTLNSMYARHPNLYPDAICNVCDIQVEDNEHLWLCSALGDVHDDIWSDALGQIDKWGRNATNAYNKEMLKLHERKYGKGNTEIPSPKPIQWVCPDMDKHHQGLSSICGTQRLLRGDGFYDRAPDLQWNIAALYRGITPRSLIKEWSALFNTQKSIARTVIHKFVGYLESQATELIWKPRCSVTVAREKELGITAKQKKAKFAGQRGAWSDGYGYICREGYCPCGSPLDEHDGGNCPGAVLDPHAADARLLESLKGMRRLDTMEGMGKTPYF